MSDPEKPRVKPVDMGRVTSKLDEYLDKQDWSAAERHLDFWMQEAILGNDTRARFSIENEIMGLKRKLGKKDEALAAAKRALELGEELNNTDTVGGATVFVNCGTVFEAFGLPEEAVAMYQRAQNVYEKNLKNDSPKLGGLYNNMAMALALCGKYDEAFKYYHKAIDVMGRVQYGQIEQALSYLNLADAYQAKLGPLDAAEDTERCLNKAEELLDSPDLPRSGYYAFMASKCIESFRYHGYFFYANELERRVKDIYDSLK